MNKEDLKNYVENNPRLVKFKKTSKDNIFVLQYAKKVFYDNLWNDYLEECRGTLVDKDYDVVSRPFSKIYNFRVEAKSPNLDDSVKVRAYRKVNGFMTALTWHNGELLISTTGSIDSDYVIYAREMMEASAPMEAWEQVVSQYPNLTFMFECVHPKDPHIIPEQPGMYCLGWREKTWESQIDGFNNHDAWNSLFFRLTGNKVETFETTVGELVKLSKKVEHEGYVAYTEDGVSFKIKSPYYLFNKFLARTKNPKKLMNKNIKQELDEEFYDLIDTIHADPNTFMAMEEQDRLEFIRNFLSDDRRKKCT